MVVFLSHQGLSDKPNDIIGETVRVEPRGVTVAVTFPLEVFPIFVCEIATEFGFRQEAYGNGLGSHGFAETEHPRKPHK